MTRKVTLSCLISVVLATPAVAHHPGGIGNIGAAGPIWTITAATLEQGHAAASFWYEYARLGGLSDAQLIAAAGQHVHAHSLKTIESAVASFGYGITNDFMIAVRAPFEVLEAMAMTPRLAARWEAANEGYINANQRASDVAATLGAFSRVLRMMLQSGVMAVGAYLVIFQEATPGVIIAGSILTSRALAPVDLAIAHWRGFVAARQSWTRLSQLVGRLAAEREPMALPAPSKSLTVEAVSVAPPGQQNLVVRDVAFRVEAGQALGIIGPSASGKSSLARALVAVWQPARGKVRIDGAALEQWPDLGRHIGYLPQDVELFDGTIAENIARFELEPDPVAIVAAAQAADVHELIVRLPDGYETAIGEGGMALSAGQRQRVALARALYRDPFLVVLDEPNSNLDAEGDEALTEAIVGVRKRMGILVVIAHRPSALTAVDLVLAMANGQAQAFGPKEEVLRKVLRPAAKPSALKVVSESSVPVS